MCISSSTSIPGSLFRCFLQRLTLCQCPSPTCATLPPSGYLPLYCLMSLTCLLPSSVVLGGLTRSCERVEAWSSLPFPFPSYSTLSCFPTLPGLSLPTFPTPPARIIRYYCYVYLLGSSPFQSHSECFLSTSVAVLIFPFIRGLLTRHTNGHLAIRPQHCGMWILHEAGQRVWLDDDGRGRKRR